MVKGKTATSKGSTRKEESEPERAGQASRQHVVCVSREEVVRNTEREKAEKLKGAEL